MRIFIIVSLFVFPLIGKAQIQDENTKNPKYIYLHERMGGLPKSFFVFTVNTCLSSNSNSPAIIQNYSVIRKSHPEKKVLFVLNEKCGVNKYNLNDYLSNDFRINPERDSLLTVIIDDSLYQKLSDGLFISKILYFSNGQILYNYDSKWHFVDEYTLPVHLLNVQFHKRIPLHTEPYRNSMNNDFYYLKDPYALQVSDVNNRVNTLNYRTGYIHKLLDLNGYNASQLYYELIAKDSNSYAYSKKHEAILDSIKRLTLPIISGRQYNDSIYLSGGLQVFIKLSKKLKFKDVYGNKFFIDPGELFAYNYSLLYHCDTNLDINKIYYIDDSTYPGSAKRMYLSGVDFAFYVKDSFLYLFNTPEYMFHSRIFLKHRNHALSKFVRRNERYIFHSFLEPKFPRDFKKALDFSLYYKLFEFNGRLYFHYDLWPEIYSVNSPEPVARLSGDGSEEIKKKFPKHMTDPEYPVLPFYIYASGPIFENYYGFIYLYNNSKILFEVFDKNWNSIQIEDISHLKGMDKVDGIKYDSSNFIFYDDGFAHLQYEDLKFWLYEYRFNLDRRPFSFYQGKKR